MIEALLIDTDAVTALSETVQTAVTAIVVVTDEPVDALSRGVEPSVSPAQWRSGYLSQSVSRERPRLGPTKLPGMWKGATNLWDRQPAWVPRWARCIVRIESWHSKPSPYRAENPTSSASGVGQWIDSTWDAHADRAHVRHVQHAAYNSRRIQDKVFIWSAKNAQYAWAWREC